jgi:type I restriction enzyme, S subunit
MSYPEYKDSKIPWIGIIPSHWDLLRAKWLFEYRKELNVGGLVKNVLSLTLRGVVNNDPLNPEGLVPKNFQKIIQLTNYFIKAI